MKTSIKWCRTLLTLTWNYTRRSHLASKYSGSTNIQLQYESKVQGIIFHQAIQSNSYQSQTVSLDTTEIRVESADRIYQSQKTSTDPPILNPGKSFRLPKDLTNIMATVAYAQYPFKKALKSFIFKFCSIVSVFIQGCRINNISKEVILYSQSVHYYQIF